MNRIVKVGLLSLIAIIQVLTLIGGFFAYEEMSQTIWELQEAYKQLSDETSGLITDFGILPNPFAPLFPLVSFGLFLTGVLLIDELRHKTVHN